MTDHFKGKCNIKLSEYLKDVRRSNSLGAFEISLFGFDDMSSGWPKRYADFEVTEKMLSVLSQHGLKAGKMTKKTRRTFNRLAENVRKYEITDNKLLYVMENSHGELKIGISVDPIKRARQLTTGSGTTTVCLVAWELDKNTRSVEGELHKEFKRFAKEGEWFTPRAFTLKDVENKISCNFKRVYTGEGSLLDSKVETEEYEYLHIKHETAKATLFKINGLDVWVPKSKIQRINTEKHVVTVPIGQISNKMKEILAA